MTSPKDIPHIPCKRVSPTIQTVGPWAGTSNTWMIKMRTKNTYMIENHKKD